MLETIEGLRGRLMNIKSNLVVAHDYPESYLLKLLSDQKNVHNIIVYQQEVCHEEL